MKIISHITFILIALFLMTSHVHANELDESIQSIIQNYEKETDHFKLAKSVTEQINDRQIVVKMKKDEQFDPARLGVTLVDKFQLSEAVGDDLSLIVVRVSERDDFFEKLAELNALPYVLHAEPNTIVESTYEAKNPYVKNQWYLHTLDIFRAWEVEKGSAEVTIGLIDSGVNRTHPKLKGRILVGYDFANNQSGGTDVNGHGTHIAGVIAANVNPGVIGLDQNVNILPIKVFNDNGKGALTNVIKGIYYAIENEVDIINMSYVSDHQSKLEKEAINKAYEQGIVLIASSGNAGLEREEYPASYKNVISVGATNEKDERASFSNYGKSLDIVAPGTGIYGLNYLGGYLRGSGTSFSAPIVSAIAALIKAKNPHWNNNEVEWVLQQSVSNHSAGSKEWNKFTGFGRVNAYQSLLAELPNKEEDIGNTIEHAYKLKNKTVVNERFQLPNDIDLYTFQLNERANIRLHIKNIPDHIDLVALLTKVNANKVEELLLIDDNGMGDDELFIRNLPKGKYYISLYDYYGRWSEKPYTIEYDILSFLDVNQYVKEIEHLVGASIIQGFADNTFKPNQPVTRLQAVTMILNEMGINVEGKATDLIDPGFSDIKRGDYGYNQITKAVEIGFIEGKKDNTFDPYGHLTRGQMAAILVRAYNLTGTTNQEFKDVPLVHWAYPYVNRLIATGITKGYNDNTYRPEQKISRQHFSLMLYRIIKQK